MRSVQHGGSGGVIVTWVLQGCCGGVAAYPDKVPSGMFEHTQGVLHALLVAGGYAHHRPRLRPMIGFRDPSGAPQTVHCPFKLLR